ncbi:MAG: hypothetical protein KDC03_01745 [Flavobacteriales bacterium]|nr:hypothetical protein [Flavobacteriales bacterium]
MLDTMWHIWTLLLMPGMLGPVLRVVDFQHCRIKPNTTTVKQWPMSI